MKEHAHDFIIDFAKDGLILEPSANGNPEDSLRFLAEFVGVEIKRFPFEVESEFRLLDFNCPNVVAFLYPEGEILILHPQLKAHIRLELLNSFFNLIAKRLN